MSTSEVKKEGLKWVFASVLAAGVVLASIALIVKPMIERLVKTVEEQHDRIGQQKQVLAGQEARLHELSESLSQAEQELRVWESRIGPLLEDKALAADLRHALELFKSLAPEERSFINLATHTVSGKIELAVDSKPSKRAIGHGFAVTRDKVGQYTLTFDPPFPTEPNVAITVVSEDQFTGEVEKGKGHPADTTVNVNPGHAKTTIWTYGINSDGYAVPQDAVLTFIATAPVKWK